MFPSTRWIAAGAKIGDPGSGVPHQDAIVLSGHALQCRVTTEDPARGFAPAHGRLTVCQSPAGNGLQRQLAAAGLRNLEAVTLERCMHWIYEENPQETTPAIIEFLRSAQEPASRAEFLEFLRSGERFAVQFVLRHDEDRQRLGDLLVEAPRHHGEALVRAEPVGPVPLESAWGTAGHDQSGSDVSRWPSLSRFVLRYLWFSGFAGTSSGSRSTTDSP